MSLSAKRIVSWFVRLFIRRGDTKWEDLRKLEEVDAVVEHYQEAVKSKPEPSQLHRLGGVLQERFKRTDKLGDLDGAISSFEMAVDFTHDNAQKPPHLNLLGAALQERFKRTDNLGDLDGAISSFERAVDFTHDNAQKPPYLHLLGKALHSRFERLDTLRDLEGALSSHQKAVEFTPDSDPDKPNFLGGLGGAQKTRFERLHDPKDLESAISSVRKAVELTPDQNKLRYITRLTELEEAERVEAERIKAERVETERIKAEHERMETEWIKAELKRIENERIKAVHERIQAERERMEAERIKLSPKPERIQAERERVEAERIEAERIEAVHIQQWRPYLARLDAIRGSAGKLREEILEQKKGTLGEHHPHTILAAESLDATRRAPKEVEVARRVISGLTSEDGERPTGSFRDVIDGDSDPLFLFPHRSNQVITPVGLNSACSEYHTDPPSIPTWLMEEHQRTIERVRLWYPDPGPLAKKMNEAPALSITGHSYRVQLVALNFEFSQTSMMVDRNSTYSHIGFQLKTHGAAALPVALEQINGPMPRWRIPETDSRVPRGLRKIYVVDLSEPFTVALVRNVEEDFPLLLALSSFNDTTTTLGDLIGAKLDGRAKPWASIRLLSSPHDIQGLPCETIQKDIEGVYSTTIFVLLTEDPLAYKFRNLYDGRVPPPLQVAFPQFRSLVEYAPRPKAFTFQAIDFSRALLHLAICLAEAAIEKKVEGALQAYLISRLKSMAMKLRGIFTDIENSTDNLSPAIAKSLHLFFYQLCEEQPGVVAVRQSLESLQALIALDAQTQGSSSEITGMNLLALEEDSVEQDGTLLPVVTSRYPSRLDGSASSDSLSSSDHESSSILAGDGLAR